MVAYSSTSSSQSSPSSPENAQLPPLYSPAELEQINLHLDTLTPQEILQWGIDNLPGLYQSTAFGLTGLAGTDMLSKLTFTPPPLIFLDTLYHFPETLTLRDQVHSRYPNTPLHTYSPASSSTTTEFESLHGQNLWEINEGVYDYLVKVEPARRAYRELEVRSIITGRRSSQSASRASLPVLEVDSTGLYKLNPFKNWSFVQVKAYVDKHGVPRNALLDQGYRSVGDWHSTQKSGEGDAGERSGRWQGKEKTECGLHEDYFKMKANAVGVKVGSSDGSRVSEMKSLDEKRGDETKQSSAVRTTWLPIIRGSLSRLLYISA
jgi:phosphoadenosine phosphosulfate reductase